MNALFGEDSCLCAGNLRQTMHFYGRILVISKAKTGIKFYRQSRQCRLTRRHLKVKGLMQDQLLKGFPKFSVY